MQVVEKKMVNALKKDSSMLSWKDIVFGSSIKKGSRYSCNHGILISSGGVEDKSDFVTALTLQRDHAPTLVLAQALALGPNRAP